MTSPGSAIAGEELVAGAVAAAGMTSASRRKGLLP